MKLASSLRIRSLLNDLSQLNSDETLVLGDESDALVLIQDPNIAFTIGRSPHFVEKPLYETHKTLLGMTQLPMIDRHFSTSPLYQSGASHTLTKKRYSALYSEINEVLTQILPDAARSWMEQLTKRPHSTYEAANSYVSKVLSETLTTTSGAHVTSEYIKEIRPECVFAAIPNKQALLLFEKQISDLCQQLDAKLGTTKTNDLLSLVVMGKAPLVSGLAQIIGARPLSQLDPEKTQEYLRAASPVSTAVPRQCIQTTEIRGHRFFANQIAIISLVSANLRSQTTGTKVDLTFGYDRHMCLGKKISIQIISEALKHLSTPRAVAPIITESPCKRDGIVTFFNTGSPL